MRTGKALKDNEIEIVWTNGSLERVQTEGWAMNGATLMMNVNGSKVIVPGTSIKRFRAAGEISRVP